jgi:hypothetical protein
MEFDLLLKLIELIKEVIMKDKIFLDKEKTMNLTLKFHRVIIIFLLLLSAATLARQQQSNLFRVPEDYPTIQAGINAAADGDTVLVADSTYYENINFKGKAITVASYFIMNGDTNHIANTVINGSQPANPNSGSVVYFVSGEDTNSVLCGFTVTGGSGTYNGALNTREGGGIYISVSGATIRNNHIIGNSLQYSGDAFGGGILAGKFTSAVIHIIENVIRSNTIDAVAAGVGGIWFGANGRISGNVIEENQLTTTASWSTGVGIACQSASLAARYVVEISENNIRTNLGMTTDPNAAIAGGGIDVYGSRDASRID